MQAPAVVVSEESMKQQQREELKQKAFAQGVVKAEDWGNGSYWVQCEDQKWLKASGQYFCRLCEKHLNDASLKDHLSSEHHKKCMHEKLGQHLDQPESAAAAPSTALVQRCCGALPEWQKMGRDGLVRCIPCNKVVDDCHISTGDHKRRLASWLEMKKLENTGYPAPELECLAWVPSIQGDETSERWLKCLLCKKFVQDDHSHSGTPLNPQGSREHQSKLKNYSWYREDVLKERRKYHPCPGHTAPTGPCLATRQASTPPPLLALPAPPVPPVGPTEPPVPHTPPTAPTLPAAVHVEVHASDGDVSRGMDLDERPQIAPTEEHQLTKEKLAAEYPQLYEYVVNLEAMSYQMLFEREELHDFWKDPVHKGGEIIKNHRILWCGEPLPSFIASLAIHTCSRLQMDLSQARNFCMSFNNKGCHSTSCSCNFFHLCLCCGSGRHGFKDCERSQELLEEAQHFQQIFGVDPLHPLSKFGGEDLESILLKLVQKDIMPRRNANADAVGTASSVEDVTDPSAVFEDPLLLWYANDGQPQVPEAEKLEKLEETQSEGDCETSTEISSNNGSLLPQEWTVEEVADWLWNLEGDRHRRYVQAFKENLIDGMSLETLTLGDLKELGVTELRNRKIMHQEIQKLFN